MLFLSLSSPYAAELHWVNKFPCVSQSTGLNFPHSLSLGQLWSNPTYSLKVSLFFFPKFATFLHCLLQFPGKIELQEWFCLYNVKDTGNKKSSLLHRSLGKPSPLCHRNDQGTFLFQVLGNGWNQSQYASFPFICLETVYSTKKEIQRWCLTCFYFTDNQAIMILQPLDQSKYLLK